MPELVFSSSAPTLRDFDDAAAALKRVEAEIDAVDPNNLSPRNVKFAWAAATAFAAAPTIRAYLEPARSLPAAYFNIHYLERIEDYTKALWFLDITTYSAKREQRDLEEQVYPRRRSLLLSAVALADRGIFNQAEVAAVQSGTGLRDAASDLTALAHMFRERWDDVKDKCCVTEEEIDAAAKIGLAVFAAVSRRQDPVPMPPHESQLRIHKAWTLLDRAYLECRRAVAFFRFLEGDADELVPSLHRTPSTKRGQSADADEQPTEPQTSAAAPAPTPEPVCPLGGNDSPFVTSKA